ncbi:MAG: S8 family serine peptidase [Sedimentisphaerales bacterium]|nr:S8 family serine peptidase [Sedimentisphaerales bacterium]
MRSFAFLTAAFTSLLLLASPAKSEETSQSPVGSWQSVDYVENVESFRPDKKSWQGELSLKEIEFLDGGTTSLPFLRWENGWLLHQDGKTKAQYYIRQMGDSMYLFMPWLSGDVTIRGQKPWYYVLKKVPDDKQPSGKEQTATREHQGAFRPIDPVDSVKEFDDVRDRDLSRLRPAAIVAVISTLDFNKDTVWPDQNLPPGKRPEKLLEEAMNPGLGVRALHRRGITGKGVNVAIIDQPLYQDHPEFAGKIVAYHDVGCGSKSSMHGPAVASLLVGTNCGTAPDAKLYYAAAPSWLKDAEYYSKSIDWILEQNAKLPAEQKIRVISVSAAPAGQGSPFEKNQQMWDDACSRAEAAGILVLDCTKHHGIIGRCILDAGNREDPTQCSMGIRPGHKVNPADDRVYAPSGPRTTAEQYRENRFTYQYNGQGGLSWTIPYAAGVLAMGWQINPSLGSEQMKEILFNSAAKGQNGAKIIYPQRFIAMVKAAKPKNASNY